MVSGKVETLRVKFFQPLRVSVIEVPSSVYEKSQKPLLSWLSYPWFPRLLTGLYICSGPLPILVLVGTPFSYPANRYTGGGVWTVDEGSDCVDTRTRVWRQT